jgi:oligosaccharide repeat unit polymerase
MEVWFLGALLLVLSFANYKIECSVLYPPFAFCFLWLFILATYQSGLVDLDPLRTETIFLLGAGAVVFTAGGACAKVIPKQLIALKLKLWSPAPEKASSSKKLLTVGVIAGMLVFLGNTIQMGLRGGLGSILANARQAGIDARQGNVASFSLLSYIPLLSMLCSTLFLIEKRDKWFWWSALAACVTAIFTTGRTPILQLFCLLISVHLIKTQRTRLLAAVRFLRWPAFLFLLLFTALIFFDKRISDIGGGILAAISFFVLGYFVLPTAALNYVVHNASYYGTAPHHTFKIFLQAGALLGLWSYTPPPLIDNFVWVPLEANVYTGYKFYFTDFGLWGCLSAVGMIAFLQTILYRRARAGSEFSLYLFAITVFPLVMFVFDDLYSEFGQLLIAIVFGCLYMASRHIRVLPSSFCQRTRGNDSSLAPGTPRAWL